MFWQLLTWLRLSTPNKHNSVALTEVSTFTMYSSFLWCNSLEPILRCVGGRGVQGECNNKIKKCCPKRKVYLTRHKTDCYSQYLQDILQDILVYTSKSNKQCRRFNHVTTFLLGLSIGARVREGRKSSKYGHCYYR